MVITQQPNQSSSTLQYYTVNLRKCEVQLACLPETAVEIYFLYLGKNI